ncbi:MAG: peptidoglycan editing factor PgeF [Candidatus Omnitrophica bacterium]|nr:peptidoglycan editing factor PgeF [Candidatus Omnitrophota bacterium]
MAGSLTQAKSIRWDYQNIFSAGVISFTTERGVDFTRRMTDSGLDEEQTDFLSQTCGREPQGYFSQAQIHGDRILIAARHGRLLPHSEADAVLTKEKNFFVGVRTADCLPVLLLDPRQRGVAAVHAGWRSTAKNIAQKTIAVMRREWGTNPREVCAALGPAIRTCCYEVGLEVTQAFCRNYFTREGKTYFDLAAENRDQLTAAGIAADHIFDCGICSCCDPRCFSYRREKEKAGRMYSLIQLV